MIDLKEILYNSIAGRENLRSVESCLSYLEYYTLLGDYKDCKERLEKCKTYFIEIYDRAINNIKETNNTEELLNAVSVLRKIRDAENKNGLPGEVIPHENIRQQIDRMMIIAADRGEKLRAKETRRKRRRTIALSAAAVFAVVLILFGFFYHAEILPANLAAKADRQLADREYEEALDSFGRLTEWKEWESRAEEGLQKAHLALGDQKMDERDYTAAFAHYHSAGEYDKEIDARITAAEICIKKRDYEEAVKQYEELQSVENTYLSKLQAEEIVGSTSTEEKMAALTEKTEETARELENARIQLAEMYIDSGQTYNAITQLKRVPRTPEVSAELKDLYMELVKKTIAELKALSEPNAEQAGILGRSIEDIDAQLRYSDALVSLGYDLAEVYPNGVPIDGTDLGLENYNTEGLKGESEFGRTLVLYRQEHDGRYSENSLYSIFFKALGEEKYKSREYSYYLYPDYLYYLPEEYRALSWKECRTLILASSGYSFFKEAKGTWGVNSAGSVPAVYDAYKCTDKVCIFGKDNPIFHITIGEKVNMPSIEDGFNMAEIGVLNIDEELFGRPDTEWIRGCLDKAVLYMYKRLEVGI